MKKTLSICLGIFFALALTFVFLLTKLETPVSAATTDFSGGSGTESDPYLIKTKEHLNNVRKDLDAHYKMISDIVFTEADFAEGGDFYNGGTGWQPIGDLGSDPSSRHEPSFAGTFDGNGHTIKNFYINIESDSYVFAGLFGYVYSGTIKNLGMEDSNITAISSAKNSYAGGIVGAAVDTEFTNCYNAGTVSGESAGGIVGGANFYVKFTSCYNTGTVSGNYAGGILGAEIASFMPDRYFHIVSNLEISNCYNTGTVSATTEAGGILGMLSSYTESESTIRNCYNNGTISVTNLNPINTTYAAGGIVGDGSCISTIIDCHNTGTIESNVSESTDGYAGGISGQGGTMTNCYNTGAVTGNYKAGGISGNGGSSNNCHNSGKIFASTFAGGIMGSGSATDCYNTGTIESASDSTNGYAGGITGSGSATNCYNTGTVTGNHNAGGISGSGSATNCYNTGAVSGAGAGGIVGYVNKSVELTSCYNIGAVSGNCTGGIVGSTAYNSTTPTIRYCYNTGEISATNCAGGIVGDTNNQTKIIDCYNIGEISATNNAGGIVGTVDYSNKPTEVSNCYNIGTVSGSNAGGIVGKNSGSIDNCYYLDNNLKGVGTGSYSAIKCTDAEMQKQATFAGFNFNTVWEFKEKNHYLYPTLVETPYSSSTHRYDNACDTTCNICGMERTVAPHDYSAQDKNDIQHWMTCSICGVIDESTREAHKHNNTCDTDCNVCGQVRDITHDYSVQDKDTTGHWMKCSVCGVIDESTRENHSYDNNCDTTCNECGYVRSITHNYTVQDKDANNHWTKCSVCGTIDESTREAHKHDNTCDTDCNVCGQVREITHTYSNAYDPNCNVCGFVRFTSGDVDNDGDVDLDDAIYLLFYVNFPSSYPVNQPANFDGLGEVTMDDAIYLLFHVNFPASYPLH